MGNSKLDPGLFQIFRSSAGSGKTYRLATEYLKLVLGDFGDFRRILAVTFTNKATNEMKARIIEFLFQISRDEAKEDLVETLCDALKLDGIQLRNRAQSTLRRILHSYSYFSVSTIDSFFQRVISAFTRDLGIKGGYLLEFEINQVKEEMIDRIFLGLDGNPDLRKWLVQFAMSKIESGKSWDIRYDIGQLAGQIFLENFRTYYQALYKSEKITDTNALSNVLEGIKEERERIRKKISNAGREGVRMIQDSNLELSDFSRGMNGPAGLFYRMADNIDINTGSKYLKEGLISIDAWFTKKSTKQHEITRLLEGGLLEHFERATKLYLRERHKDNTYLAVQQYFYNLGILSNLMDSLKDYREENDVVLISDLSNLLNIVIGENDAPFIYEKVGNFYNHFLIDEFQDTSSFQWSNFQPLVINSLAAGKFNMIVGDVKQSIYRWRGGDWEILQNKVEEDVSPFTSGVVQLDRNWRSLKNIVNFNNKLFTALSYSLRQSFLEELHEIHTPELRDEMRNFSIRFQEAYADVRQEMPETKEYFHDGIVEIRFITGGKRDQEESSWKKLVLPEMVDRIQCLQERGYTPKDIAVLVRTKDEGRMVANYILDYKGTVKSTGTQCKFDVISSESLFLKASPVVNIIIYFIKLINDPEDVISMTNFYYWLAILKYKGQGIDYGYIFKKATSPGPEELVDLNRRLLGLEGTIQFTHYRSVPLANLVEEIVQLLNLSDHKEERVYLMGLQNTVLEFLDNNNNDLHAFIHWWSTEGKEKSIKPSLEQDAIHILTIHQSKGLQYKNVLIPFCSWDIDHNSRNDNIIWGHSELPVLDQIPYFPLRYSKKLAETDFVRDYYNEKSLAYMDNLNLLYVAFTRAEEGLFVWAEFPEKPERRKTVGDLLMGVFSGSDATISREISSLQASWEGSWDAETHVFRSGQIATRQQSDKEDNKYTLQKFTKGRWQGKITIRQQADILDFVGEDKPGERVNYGIMLHNLLARIHTCHEVDTVLKAAEQSGEITKEDLHILSGRLSKLLDSDKVSEWFSGSWSVKTEVPVLPETGHIRRMDRVMIKGREAIVVDYKTGSMRQADLGQVRDYMNILVKMGYLPVKGYLWYLSNNELIEI